MKKKYLVIIFVVSSYLLFSLVNKEILPDYDDYKEIYSLSQKSIVELKKDGYSDFDIKKIEVFRFNYKNHLTLLDIVESSDLENYGYNNRSLSDEVKRNFIFKENYYTKQDSNLSYTTTIMDFVSDENNDAARIIIEFEWTTKPYSQNQYINVKYKNYAPKNIYTLLKYKNTSDEFEVVYRMSEIPYSNFFDAFYTEFVTRKTINRQNYILESGIIVLDLKSYYLEGLAPLSISSQYVGKPLFRKEKILSEQWIIEAQKIKE